MKKSGAKKRAIIEDGECWSIAESMVEEIEQIRGLNVREPSANDKLKSNFKRMLMNRMQLTKKMRSICR